MIDRFIAMLEHRAGQMAVACAKRLASDPGTRAFRVLEAEQLYQELYQLYSRLGHWLLAHPEKGEIRDYYRRVGEQRFEDGFPLQEVASALMITKSHIWEVMNDEGVLHTPAEIDAAIDLVTLLNRFFDMALYHTAVGYYGRLEKERQSQEAAEKQARSQ